MNIIDFHAHIYPDKIAARAVESIGDFYGLHMDGKGTADALLAEDKSCGITKSVVHSVAVTPERVGAVNDYIMSECSKHSEFIGFGTIHAGSEDKIPEVERFLSAGLKGVKIHPDTQLFEMDDERMNELYDYLAQCGIPILIHCGDYRYGYSHPSRLKKILHRFPKLTVVAAHFGGWSIFDLAYEYLADEHCYLDTSSSFPMTGLRRARELIRLYGAERMVFGTDFPMWNVADELEEFMNIGLGDDENELILHKNAEKILGIDKTPDI